MQRRDTCRRRFLAVALLLTGAVSAAASPFSVSARMVQAEGVSAVEVSVGIAERHYLYADRFAVSGPPGVTLRPLAQASSTMKFDESMGTNVLVYTHGFTNTYAVEGAAGGIAAVTVGYQGCNDTVCFMPESVELALGESQVTGVVGRAAAPAAPTASAADRHTVAGRAVGYMAADEFLRFLESPGSGEETLGGMLARKGLWVVVLFILAGGVALNLTPCVLPMIPINLAIIGAGAAAGTRGRGFVLGSVYGAGMALAYGVLGAAVVTTGAKFGAVNGTVWFNVLLAVLFLVFGLAMFDLLTVDFSRFQGRLGGSPGKPRGRYVTAFVLGGVSAVLAGACVAPVLISVLVFSGDMYARGNAAGLVLPFLLGAGMALPWPFAGAGMAFLPRPGRWMEHVKHGFGVLILAFAAWYGFQAWEIVRARSGADATGAAAEAAGWVTSLDEVFAQAAATGRPVLLDFWASWCKNCHAMDATTLRDPGVVRALDRFAKAKIRAEDLNDPATRAMLDRFGVLGLPTYVILVPR